MTAFFMAAAGLSNKTRAGVQSAAVPEAAASLAASPVIKGRSTNLALFFYDRDGNGLTEVADSGAQQSN